MKHTTIKPAALFDLLNMIKVPAFKIKATAEIRTSPKLVDEMLDELPNSLWKKGVRFLDPCCGRGTFLLKIIDRLLPYHSPKRIAKMIIGIDISEYCVYTTKKLIAQKLKVPASLLINTVIEHNFLEWNTDMKFDVIVGNPPYQDGSSGGGQDKIYNSFCKNSLDLLSESGCMAFITPSTVCKKSKRFSLINLAGLTTVDFSTDSYFNVGINICSWTVNRSVETGTIEVTNKDKSKYKHVPGTPIYDYSVVNKNFTLMYDTLKSLMDSPDKRMFNENNFGDAVSKIKTKGYNDILYSVNKNKENVIYGYSKRTPFFKGKKKIIIPMTKTLNEESVFVDTADYYQAYLCIGIENKKEADNIKSFIFSAYFTEHARQWRELDGYGYNYALKYLPPFDKTKSWTNATVKKFIESFSK